MSEFDFGKISWRKGESMKPVDIMGEMVVVNRNGSVMMKDKFTDKFVQVPIDTFLANRKLVQIDLLGGKYFVNFFNNVSANLSLLMSCLYVCFPTFRKETPMAQREQAEKLLQIFERLFELDDAVLYKILTRKDRQAVDQLFTDLNQQATTRQTIQFSDMDVKVDPTVMAKVFLEPDYELMNTLFQMISSEELRTFLETCSSGNDILDWFRRQMRTKVAQAGRCSKNSYLTFERLALLTLKRMLKTVIPNFDVFPVSVFLDRRGCAVMVYGKSGKKTPLGEGGDRYVLYSDANDRIGVVGKMKNGVFEVVRESDLVL